ncbi:MAG: sigma-70 family RNA polymerase sigma factor [Clostridia bacterium]|nr:sigma-70 family RNA polymerase sigma factor [Clostridia bacterium]
MEELLILAGQGDQEAILSLWERYRPCAYKAAARYAPCAYADRDDFRQCAYLGFYEAIIRRDERYALTDLIGWYVRRECRKLLGLYGSRHSLETGLSLDAPAPDGETTYAELVIDEDAQPHDAGMLEEDLIRDVRNAVSALPDREQRIIRAHDLEGVPIARIAAQEGLSGTRTGLLRQRAMKRLKADPVIRKTYACDFARRPFLYGGGLRSYVHLGLSVQELALLCGGGNTRRTEKDRL